MVLELLSLVLTAGLAAEPSFTLVEDSGVEFVHRCGSAEKDWILEVNGSGVALFDADDDGDLDIYLVNCGDLDANGRPVGGPKAPKNALYRNDGEWKFTDVTSVAGVGDTGWGSSASVADVDNDGHLDLYVTNYGPNVLYLGRGEGKFTRAGTSGIPASGLEDTDWSTSACFSDLDRDGDVDCYVVNYLNFSSRCRSQTGARHLSIQGPGDLLRPRRSIPRTRSRLPQ